MPARQGTILRGAILATSALTFLLNLYALAAVASRTVTYGLTPNRHAVLGWNVITLLFFAIVTLKTWRPGVGDWAIPLSQWIGRFVFVPVAWALWVLLVVSYF